MTLRLAAIFFGVLGLIACWFAYQSFTEHDSYPLLRTVVEFYGPWVPAIFLLIIAVILFLAAYRLIHFDSALRRLKYPFK